MGHCPEEAANGISTRSTDKGVSSLGTENRVVTGRHFWTVSGSVGGWSPHNRPTEGRVELVEGIFIQRVFYNPWVASQWLVHALLTVTSLRVTGATFPNQHWRRIAKTASEPSRPAHSGTTISQAGPQDSAKRSG